MKKKLSKREHINLLFSAFLMIAYICCGYFFAQFAETLGGGIAKAAVTAAILAIFGLLVFYATRVGEGKAIKRFSLITLILLDIPALYIIIASIFEPVFLHEQLTKAPIVVYMAAMAFGYGVPYTFFSGFETVMEEEENAEAVEEEEPAVLEGGVEADLEEEEEDPAEEESEGDEVVVEGIAADDDAETEETKDSEETEEKEAAEEDN